MRTLKGHLEFVPHEGYYFLIDEEDDFEIVRFEEDMEIPPLNEPLEIHVDEEQFVDGWVLLLSPAAQGLLAQPDELPIVRLGIFKFCPEDSSEENIAIEQAKAEKAALEVKNYYRYYSGDRLDIDVLGYAVPYDGYCTPPYYAKDTINRFIKDNGISYPFTHYHGWCGKSTRQVCGLATLGGNRGATYPLYACGVRTLIHEFGHNLGLLHCGTVKGETETEYGDTTSVMGSGQQSIEGHGSWHLMQKGWYDGSKRYELSTSQEVLLDPIELHPLVSYSQVHQFVVVQDDNQKYTISTRKQHGTLYPQNNKKLLYVHRIDDGNATKFLEPALKVGETKYLPNGARIRFLDYLNETARVEVRYHDEDFIQTLSIPIGFPTPELTVPIVREHTGAWYDQKYTGQGFNIFVQDETVVVYWYTYRDDGSPLYYVCVGQVQDNVAHLEVNITSGGTFDDPKQRVEKTVGMANLYFTDANRAVFLYDLPGIYDRGAVELTPVLLAPNADSSPWWAPELAGSGFGLMFYQLPTGLFDGPNEHCAGYWYTFDNNRKHRWFILIGGYSEKGSYECTIYEYYGGQWMFYDRPSEEPCGTALISKDGPPGTILLSYELYAKDLTKFGQQLLTSRL